MKKYKVETKVIKNFNDTKDNNKPYEVGEPIVLDRARYEELLSKGFVEEGKILEDKPSFKKEIREDKDITQNEVAEAIGTTKQQIYAYEKGINKMSVERLKEMCLYYGVSADYILGLPKGLKWYR